MARGPHPPPPRRLPCTPYHQLSGECSSSVDYYDYEYEVFHASDPFDFLQYSSLQLIDLGEPAYNHASAGGCRSQDTACPGGCGVRGHCVGGLEQPHCECDAGLTGPECSFPTVPARLGAASYVKVALSFTPGPQILRLQVRVRMRGAHTGLLLHLASHHRASAFTLHVRLISPLHTHIICATHAAFIFAIFVSFTSAHCSCISLTPPPKKKIRRIKQMQQYTRFR